MLILDSMPSFNVPIQVYNENNPQQFSPSIWIGPYNSLYNPHFLAAQNIQIIINCSSSVSFIETLHDANLFNSNILSISVDPDFLVTKENTSSQLLALQFIKHQSRLISKTLAQLNLLPQDIDSKYHEPSLDSSAGDSLAPIMSSSLKSSLFKINELLKSHKTLNPQAGVLLISRDGNLPLSTAVAMSFLIYKLGFNCDTAYGHIKNERPSICYYGGDSNLGEVLGSFCEECLARRLFGNETNATKRKGDNTTQITSKMDATGKRRRDD